jgi:hypothetical protein
MSDVMPWLESKLFEVEKKLFADGFSYPRVSDASDGFLRDPGNGIPKTVQEVVKMIQRGPEICKFLDEYPAIRRAYSFIKRWVAIRGLGMSLPDNRNLKALLEYQKDISDSISEDALSNFLSLMNRFCEHTASKADPLLQDFVPSNFHSFSTDNWEAYLVELMGLPVEKKLDCTYTIRVMVTYSGVSQMKGAQWLLMVQRKLSKLKHSKSIPSYVVPCLTFNRS